MNGQQALRRLPSRLTAGASMLNSGLHGTPWLPLRLCLTCGHVGCCDLSPMKHASKHAHVAGHPIVRSFEPGKTWRRCSVDQAFT